MDNKHMKRFSPWLSIKKSVNQNHNKIPIHTTKMTIISEMVTRFVKKVEKLETSYNIKGTAALEISLAVPQKVKKCYHVI